MREKERSMQSVVGIFTDRATAEQALSRLRALGIPEEHLNLLTPKATEEQLEAVPTTEAEQPGIGQAIGGVVGAAMGGSGGLIGATIASALIPGIGTVTAIGLTAVGLLGMAAGALTGVVAGGALENSLSHGLPKDELYIYKDALRRGRTVVMALTEDTDQAEAARQAVTQAGAESLDAARQNWWVGVRDAEEETYTAQHGDFLQAEAVYRRGFEAALRWEVAGKSYDEATGYLRTHYGDVYEQEAFRRGYARGRVYAEG
jgi:hypothetical protein